MRSPLTTILRRALRQAAANHDANRRQFIRTASMAAVATSLPPLLVSCGKASDIPRTHHPRIVIVGAGLAGLHAAYRLHKLGITADVYEASAHLGGRVRTAQDYVIDGAYTELGGEFIDSVHSDMLSLASEFNLELMDLESGNFAKQTSCFWFGGQLVTEEELANALAPYIERFRSDVAMLPGSMSQLSNSMAVGYDAISLEAYFTSVGVTGWIRGFLETAFVTENGLELGEQSALNALSIMSTDLSDGVFRPYGESDERFKVVGGNEKIPSALAKGIRERIHTSYALERIAMRGTQFVLTFRKDLATVDVPADIVLCTLPFTVLRTIGIDVPMPEKKRRAIDTLRYGSNAKIAIAVDEPFWHRDEYNGVLFSDQAFQLAWDHTAFQPTAKGGLTFFSGGAMCRELGKRPLESVVRELYAQLEQPWPRSSNHPVLASKRFHWPSYQFSRGSYSSYGPGQWAELYGSEFEPVGNLYFAGEHCSTRFKGYMNGAAETGRRAADEIAKAVGALRH